MHKRGIAAVSIVILLLTVFFQLNRMDILPKIFSSKNIRQEIVTDIQVLDAELLAQKECYLVLYDSTSVYSTHGKIELEKYLVKLKRRIESRYFAEETDYAAYKAVIVAVDELAGIPENILKRLSQYVKDGGAVYLTGIMSPNWFFKQAGGIAKSAEMQEDYGIRLYNHAFIGIDDFACKSEVFSNYFLPCSLTSDTKIFVKNYGGQPLLWERNYGKGKYVVFNSINALKKAWRGIFIIGLSRLHDDFSYPIIGAKLVFIDDFPAPVPAGKLDSIYNEFKMDTEDFYQNIWWPDMLSISAAHHVKYTGLVIQSYNDKVKGPFISDAGDSARKYLVSYGRELLKSGGEIGIHGYNHQSLAMEGYNQEELEYNAWESPEDMRQALEALKKYIESVYPQYVIRTYVPPSNILSPEGKAMIRKVFPTVNIFCSLYTSPYEERCLNQDFSRNADHTYDIPRVSAGFEALDDTYMSNYSVINAYGISTHFVHPDELYYEEKEGQSWGQFRKSFGEFTKEINNRYPWLRAATASETAHYMDTYFDFDYVTRYLENGDLEFLTNGVANAYLILRTTKEIQSAEGCLLKNLGHGAYLLQTEKTTRCLISFKKQKGKE